MSTPSPVFNQDPSAADWIGPRLSGDWGHVTGVVPAGFAAYARILHPVEDGATWAHVADEFGTVVHPLVQWISLLRRRPSATDWTWHGTRPDEGNLDPPAVTTLLRVLAQHTSTAADCWFCVWDGYGWLNDSPVAQTDAPPGHTAALVEAKQFHVRLPGRSYLLGQGPLSSALAIGWQHDPDWFTAQSPNIFWPADRAWCVATEIDFDSTLVAGSQQLIDQLLQTDGLETWPIQLDASLQVNADKVNTSHPSR